MAATRITDLIVPEVFNPYVIERTAELSAFWQSGVVAAVAGITVPNGGTLVNMPFFQDLDGSEELLDEDDNLSVANIAASKDVAVVHARGKAWGATDLAAAFTGSDPMGAIGDLVAAFWSRRMQACLIASLKGAMAAASDNRLDITGLSGAAAYIDGSSFVDACQVMGDAKAKIVAVAMHSAVASWLKKNDLIEFIPDSEGKETLPFFQGKRVIEDDGLPHPSGDTYTTYLFGAGAVGYAEGGAPVPTETDRLPLTGGGQDILVNRRHFVLHPRGIKWNGNATTKQTPSNTELQDVANWTQVYETKNIRIVEFEHKIG